MHGETDAERDDRQNRKQDQEKHREFSLLEFGRAEVPVLSARKPARENRRSPGMARRCARLAEPGQ
jgi:hypothetical protein